MRTPDEKAQNAASELAFRIDHTMLPVSNLDASIAFYTSTLAMHVFAMRRDDERGLRVAHLGYGERGLVPTIELSESCDGDSIAASRRNAGHVAIQVSDLGSLESLLAAQGRAFASPPAAGGRGLIAWLSDPDGHPIELIQQLD